MTFRRAASTFVALAAMAACTGERRPLHVDAPAVVAPVVTSDAAPPPPPPREPDPPARAPSDAGGDARAPLKLVGVWTRSPVSYEDAAKSIEAERYSANGVFETGKLDRRTKRFVADRIQTLTPHFVLRWELTDGTLVVHNDGADEHVELLVDAPDRFRTEYVDGANTVVQYFVRRAER